MNPTIKVTQGVETKIWNSIDIAITRNDHESTRTLLSFVAKVLLKSVGGRSIPHFQAYINFASSIYSLSYQRAKSNSSLVNLHRSASELSTRHLKEIILYKLRLEREKETKTGDKSVLNPFYYNAYNGYCRLLLFVVNNGDNNFLNFAIEQFDQLSDVHQSDYYSLRSELMTLSFSSLPENQDRIEQLKEAIKIDRVPSNYRRHTIAGIKYWTFLLYLEDRIDEQTALNLLDKLNIPYREPSEPINDILFFRSGSAYDYFGWHFWDFMERPEGKTYSPPNHYRWLTLGFLVDQLRNDTSYVNIDEIEFKHQNDVEFLYNDLVEETKCLKESFAKWEKLLKVDSEETLAKRINSLLQKFSFLKRHQASLREKTIANSPLSEEKIEAFQSHVGKSWLKEARIHYLFTEKGDTEEITDGNVKLKWIGQRLFLEKSKMMFIDNLEYFQIIHGSDQIGGQIGRWEDDNFFATIFEKQSPKVTSTNIVSLIDSCIAELSRRNVSPDMIFVSSEHTYYGRALSSDPRFVPVYHNHRKDGEPNFLLLGSFDSIQVYTSLSAFLSNSVIACNFKSAFKMRYKKNPSWFNEKLFVDVKDISTESAEQRLSRESSKWLVADDGSEISHEDAIVLIKTSVELSVWTTIDFVVKDVDQYITGSLISEP